MIYLYLRLRYHIDRFSDTKEQLKGLSGDLGHVFAIDGRGVAESDRAMKGFLPSRTALHVRSAAFKSQSSVFSRPYNGIFAGSPGA
jgi:hypothetical protein